MKINNTITYGSKKCNINTKIFLGTRQSSFMKFPYFKEFIKNYVWIKIKIFIFYPTLN